MIIEKYTSPTHLDIAEFGTMWRVIGQEVEDVYIQVSKDTTAPEWQRFGLFLEKIFTIYLEHKDFINECLHLFGEAESASINKIIKIIKKN